jgi:hypothetical protein
MGDSSGWKGNGWKGEECTQSYERMAAVCQALFAVVCDDACDEECEEGDSNSELHCCVWSFLVVVRVCCILIPEPKLAGEIIKIFC